MSYHLDVQGDIVIDTFGAGTGADPYSGLTDAKGVNLSSINNEASVSFATASIIKAPTLLGAMGTVSTTSGGLFLALSSLKIEQGQWVIFTNIATGGTGLSINTPYYLFGYTQSGLNTQYQLYAATSAYPPGGSAVTISVNSNVTFNIIGPSIINYFQKSKSYNFAVDSNGRVWSDRYSTAGAPGVTSTNSWTWIGNQGQETDTSANGNGLLLFTTVHNGTGGGSPGNAGGVPPTFDEWLFVWRNAQIDYTQISSAGSNTSISWVNGWNYQLTTGTTTGQTGYLNTGIGTPHPHPALVTPDSRVNFCDGNYIGNWYQNIPALGTTYTGFNPATAGTWTPQTITAVLPTNEVGQCLTFVNQYLLIGGTQNIIYPWDLNPADNTYSIPLILLPESNIQCLVTVGQNAYIFPGNRGNIYITNGSAVSLFKKVPDHISGQVEPLFQWGAGNTTTIGVSPQSATYNKDRLYFGVSGSYQNGGNINGYGGVWCLDLNSNAIYQVEQLSYGTWNGYASAIGIRGPSNTNPGSNTGYGLLIGWSDGVTPTYGIDEAIATPYTNGSSWVVSDLIPVGTFLHKATPYQFEFKLAMPLQTDETVQLLAGYSLSDYANNTMTAIFTTTGDGVLISDNSSNHAGSTVQNQEWLILQAKLTSISSNPSYNRIVQMRVIGDSLKTSLPQQPYALP